MNRTLDLGWPPAWEGETRPLLWDYQLHGFEYIWALEFPSAREVVLDWLAHARELARGAGWHPYPTSLRLGNWCSFFFGPHRQETEAEAAFCDRLWAGIAAQAAWLARNLETHLLGNHLFENAAALALAGSCFSAASARRWKELGLRWLRRELAEQFLPDGAHYERSPMYHGRLVRVLFNLDGTGDGELRELLGAIPARAADVWRLLCHPDGEIALLNDSVFGEQPRPSDLATGGAAPLGPFALPHAGYYGWRGRDGTYLVCDAGPLGPDCQPGHGHADIFSFEMSLCGQRVIVDSGVGSYEPGAVRAYCRSTAAHNTVEIDGQSQAELWAAFRVARRGRPHEVQWRPGENGFELSGWHDGYRRLAGKPRHARRFEWVAPVLRLTDTVEACRPVTVCARLHLHPACRIRARNGRRARVEYPGGELLITFEGEGSVEVEAARYFPELGKEEENLALVFRAAGRTVRLRTVIAPP